MLVREGAHKLGRFWCFDAASYGADKLGWFVFVISKTPPQT